MNNFAEYAGLPALAGVRTASFPLARPVVCPLCASSSVALLMGKISFSATISGDDLFDGPLLLAAFVCRHSHVFFLREPDIVPGRLTLIRE